MYHYLQVKATVILCGSDIVGLCKGHNRPTLLTNDKFMVVSESGILRASCARFTASDECLAACAPNTRLKRATHNNEQQRYSQTERSYRERSLYKVKTSNGQICDMQGVRRVPPGLLTWAGLFWMVNLLTTL